MSDEEQKEPMIGQESRPSQLNLDATISNLTVRQLTDLLRTSFAPEWYKPEHQKEHKEYYKEYYKEHYKEYLKPEIWKELAKPEGFKPGPDPLGQGDIVEQIATRVVAKMREQG